MTWLTRRADPEGVRMSTWSPDRRRFAVLSVATAAATAALWLALAGWGQVPGAVTYVAVTAGALFVPAGITVQVLAGLALVAHLLLGQGGPHPLLLVPVVVCVVVTAELLAVVARLDSPLWCEIGDALPRAWSSAALAGAVYAGVVLAAGVPGPGGTVAVVLASAAFVVASVGLIRRAG